MARLSKFSMFALMPVQWVLRGCFDWKASRVAWTHALAWLIFGRAAKFNGVKR